MRLLGLIGGTSWHSTIEYYRGINEGVSQQIGPKYNPELLLHSINVEVMRSGDEDRIRQTYLDVSKKLEAAGATGILICANTPHLVYPLVQPQINIPILHIADAIGTEAKRLELNSLGLLGTHPTMTGDFISGRLKDTYQISTILPDDCDEVHRFIADELTQGIFSPEAKAFYLQQMNQLLQNGAEGIILGCTELPILMKDTAFEVPLLATTDLHVQMAVDFILS